MQLKHKKRFVQGIEKVLWLIEHVKSVLQSFLYYWHFDKIILCWGFKKIFFIVEAVVVVPSYALEGV